MQVDRIEYVFHNNTPDRPTDDLAFRSLFPFPTLMVSIYLARGLGPVHPLLQNNNIKMLFRHTHTHESINGRVD